MKIFSVKLLNQWIRFLVPPQPAYLINKYMKQWICYLKVARFLPKLPTPKDEIDGSCIFVFWDKGFSEAPALVKQCLESIKRNAGSYKVVELNRANLLEYIQLPPAILKKYDSSVISQAAFSDLVRICLLAEHGGVWVDATCYMTSEMPEIIKKQSFFMFQTPLFDFASPIKASSWFIKANKNNIIACTLKEMMVAYWMKEKKNWDYFMFHIALARLIDSFPKLKDMWNVMPYYSNQTPHLMQYSFNKEITEELKNHLKQNSFVHKLTYKYDEGWLSKEYKTVLEAVLDGQI